MRFQPFQRTILNALPILLIWCCAGGQILWGQPASSRATNQAATTFHLIEHLEKLYVPARINGQNIGLLGIDTGSSNCGLYRDAARKLKLTAFVQKSLNEYSGKKMEDLIFLDQLEIGPLKFTGIPVFTCDCETETLKDGQVVVGTIGMDILGRQPFAINFREGTLELYDPASFVAPAAQSYKLRPDCDTPMAPVSIEGHEGLFEIDTGSRDTILLSRAFSELHLDLITGRPVIRMGWNWGDSADSYVVRWNSVDILGHHITEENGSFDGQDRFSRRVAGLLGTAHFQECKLTIDMASRRVWREGLAPEPLEGLVQRLRSKSQHDLAGRSAIYLATELNRPDAVRRMVELGEAADVPEGRGLTALVLACVRGYGDIAEMLLAHGAKVDTKVGSDRMTAILFASRFGHLDCVKQLVAAGADVNQTTVTLRSPLFVAAEGGYVDLVRFLLDKGAKVDQALFTGETPLLAACSNNNTAIAGLLLARGANANATGRRGTSLKYAAGCPSPECVKLLLEHGADPNRVAPLGYPPLVEAAGLASHTAAECVRLLLAAGANPAQLTQPTDTSPKGKSALDIAVERGHVETITLLRGRSPLTPSTRTSNP